LFIQHINKFSTAHAGVEELTTVLFNEEEDEVERIPFRMTVENYAENG
jgi:hypothetical protein